MGLVSSVMWGIRQFTNPGEDKSKLGNVSSSTTPEGQANPPFSLKQSALGVLHFVNDWGVLIFMMVLPGIIDDYRIVFGLAFGLGVLFTLINAYRYHNKDLKIFLKILKKYLTIFHN